MRNLLLFFSAFFFLGSFMHLAAQDKKRYLVYFKDRSITDAHYHYSLDKPEEFLSQRAIERRKRQSIALATKDMPIQNSHIQALKATGAGVWYVSRWLNAALIEADEATLVKVKALRFVKPETDMVSPNRSPTNGNKKTLTDATFKNHAGNEKHSFLQIDSIEHYGRAYNQAKMLEVSEMHKRGYRGQGMVIAVFDAGFLNGDKVPFLKHLHDDKRILGTYNFVEGQEDVYRVSDGSHGLEVLSCMGGYEKGKIIGTAPEASYYLFRTEDAATEHKVEEFNWLIAAEKADSLGADLINSSLGYTDFDDDTQDYTYKDMNGKKSIASRAATWAASVGIIVVNSVGNEGGGDWRYMGAPADADSILSVGALDANKARAYFSSYGPTYDKRLKPNLSAQGSPATVGKPSGNIGNNSGTSFSSPVLCGMVASFWQAFPQLTNMEIIEVLQESASQATKPDTITGYGIPNCKLAYTTAQLKIAKAKTGFHLFPNPLPDGQALRMAFSEYYQGKKIKIELINMKGSILESVLLHKAEKQYEWNNIAKLNKGLYIIRVIEGKNAEMRRWLKE